MIKLSCRHLWKVFGSRPAHYFEAHDQSADPLVVAEKMRAEGCLPAVADASFEVMAGEIFVIMGLSGSGKSTLVRCLSRLVEPSMGEIVLDGRDLSKVSGKELIKLRRHTMGMVFQNFGLLPHLTALDNVAFPLKIQGKALRERQARAREMIALVGLEGREGSFPHQLSGGQQQRVGIARSLAVGPELWFLDEPFSALDPLIRKQMQDEFLRLQRMLQKTIVFITHDIAEAFRLADRLAIMRGGRIVQIGRPAEIVLNPADDYVAQFTEDMPLMRIIKAGDLATPADGATADNTISSSASLEELVPRIASGARVFTVVSDENIPPAILSADAVLDVLKRDAARGGP